MDAQKIIDVFKEIETDLPVYDWKYKDIDLWPLCKWIIYNMEVDRIQPPTQKKTDPSPSKSLISLRLRLYNYYLKGLYKYISLNKLKKVDTIFYGANAYRTDFNGFYINKFFEPLKGGNSYLSIVDDVVKEKNYKEELRLYLSDYEGYFEFILRFKSNKIDLYNNDFIGLVNYLSKDFDINTFLLRLKSAIKRTIEYSILFEKVLKKTKPKQVYGLCYYIPRNHGLHYAANKLNIPNYDIQHGGQGHLHPMYNFENFPKNKKINTLPQIFWVWDDLNYKNVQSWTSKNTFHTVENNGNPWWYHAINQTADQINKNIKIILYTLQTELLDDYILDAIKKTPTSCIWYIRMHPRYTHYRKELINQLKDNNLYQKSNIDEASNLPLPYLLEKCSLHVSKSSGSIVEAEAMKKPSIILEEFGMNNYREFIKNGYSVGLQNPSGEKIVRILNNIIQS